MSAVLLYRLRAWRILLPILVVAIATHTLFGTSSLFPSSWSAPPSTPVDVLSILSNTPDHLEKYLYTETAPLPYSQADVAGEGLAQIGSPAGFIRLPNTEVIDVKSGEPFAEILDNESFNLAILPLPPGSKWHYVGVARGPKRRREFLKAFGYASIEHIMLG